MRTVRSTIALLLAFLLAAALSGCAASPSGGQLASTPGSGPAKPVDAADFMSYAGPVFPLTLAQAPPTGRYCSTARLMPKRMPPRSLWQIGTRSAMIPAKTAP